MEKMRNLYILGAGASRGHGAQRYPKPPNIYEFFHHRFMSRLQERYKPLWVALKEATERTDMSLSTVNIEQLFSLVEPIWELGIIHKKVSKDDPFGDLPNVIDFVTPLDLLRSWVVDVIHLSTGWLRNQDCPLHRGLAERAAERNESIITFNYDLIMDLALLHIDVWDSKIGYGWDSHGKKIRFGSYTGYESTISDAGSCLLLKPHGSINFFRSSRYNERTKGREGHEFFITDEVRKDSGFSAYQSTDCIEIREPTRVMNARKGESTFGSPPLIGPSFYESYSKGNEDLKLWYLLMIKTGRDLMDSALLPYLVMPTPFKSLPAMQFCELNLVWKLVSKVIERADKIVSIGFSFNDPHFNSLLMQGTNPRKRPVLIVTVSPHSDTIEDIKRRLRAANVAIDPFYGTFADFVKSNWK